MIFDPEEPFVHAPQFQRSEVYVPQAVAHFFETHVFAGEGVGDADPALVPADPTIAADQPDVQSVRGIPGGELPRQLAPRGLIVRGGRLLIQGFVRTLVVVLVTKPIEADLLRLQIPAGRTRGLRLERPVHALMAPVLLRGRGRDQLREDPEPNPPDRQRGQPAERGGRERARRCRSG